jgi:addiction module toxin, RelE/StbE family
MSNLEYRPVAVKQLKKLNNTNRKKVIRKLELLSRNPLSGKMLKGEFQGLRSLRAWPYRIIYESKGKSLIILSITHRQSAY